MIHRFYHRRAFRALLAPLAYAGCALLFTYPLVFRLATHVPGEVSGDVPVYIWNLWWMKQALCSDVELLYSNYIFAPYGVSLAFHAFVFLKAFMAVPLQYFTTAWTSYNILVLFTFSAAAYGMYLLARHLTGSTAAAWVAGLIYGFSPYMLARGTGHFNYLSSEWIPFYILCLLRLVDEGKRCWALGAAAFLLATAYSEYYYLIYLVMFTGFYLGYLAWRQRARILKRNFLVNFALMGSLAVVGFSPILWVLFGIDQSGFIYGGWSGSGKLGADLLGFFVPPPHSLLYQGWGGELFARFTGGNGMEATVFTGYTVLALVLWGVWKLRAAQEVRLWAWITLIFAVLALGPLLHIGGDFVFGVGSLRFAFPLPYIGVHYLPLIKGVRVAARFDIMVCLGLAVLSAYALNFMLQSRARSWPLTVGLAALISLEYFRLPYPTAAVEIPSIYRQIARDQRDVAVLEIPLCWRTGWGSTGRHFDVQQLFQVVHGKRLIGGFASRVPQRRLEEMEALPLAGSLLALQEGVEAPVSPTVQRREHIRAQLAELLDHLPNFVAQYAKRDASVRNFLHPAPAGPLEVPLASAAGKDLEQLLNLVEQTRLGYVIVHPPYSGHAPLVNYLEGFAPLAKFYDRDGVVGFRVVRAVPPSSEHGG